MVKKKYFLKAFDIFTDGLSDKVKNLKAWNNAIHIASYVLGINDKINSHQ